MNEKIDGALKEIMNRVPGEMLDEIAKYAEDIRSEVDVMSEAKESMEGNEDYVSKEEYDKLRAEYVNRFFGPKYEDETSVTVEETETTEDDEEDEGFKVERKVYEE